MTEKKRVMVLDDSKTIRTTTEGYLRELDYDVQCCTDGLNGISHMLDFNPDILLIDMETVSYTHLTLPTKRIV